MSDYEDEHFEKEEPTKPAPSLLGATNTAGNIGQDEKKHLLKLSIDLLAVKDFRLSANVFV